LIKNLLEKMRNKKMEIYGTLKISFAFDLKIFGFTRIGYRGGKSSEKSKENCKFEKCKFEK